MNIQDSGTIEIENFTSETYSCLRTWLLPILLEFLSKNKHVEYPQRVFEQGLVSVKDKNEAWDYEKIAVVSANDKADYTEMRKILDYLLRMLNLTYKVDELEHNSFIPGRIGKIIVNGKEIGLIGEISPKVLENFGLEVPVAALELNLNYLFNEIK